MKVAAVDLGTNSFLCLIVEGTRGRVERVLSDEVQITRLGEGVHEHGRFSDGALSRAEEAFRFFARSIEKHGAEKIKAVATSAARDVTNASALLALGGKYGIPIEVISGEREAELTFRGAALGPTGVSAPKVGEVVIDVGGGSTEIIFQDTSGSLHGASLDIGGVRLTELFVPKEKPSAQGTSTLTEHEGRISQDSLSDMRAYVHNAIKKLQPIACSSALAVAGTPTSLAAAILNIGFKEDAIHGFKLTQELLDAWVLRLSNMTLAERGSLPGIGPKRADIIVAGTLILGEVLRFLKISELQVSTRGLRYGLALSLLETP